MVSSWQTLGCVGSVNLDHDTNEQRRQRWWINLVQAVVEVARPRRLIGVLGPADDPTEAGRRGQNQQIELRRERSSFFDKERRGTFAHLLLGSDRKERQRWLRTKWTAGQSFD